MAVFIFLSQPYILLVAAESHDTASSASTTSSTTSSTTTTTTTTSSTTTTSVKHEPPHEPEETSKDDLKQKGEKPARPGMLAWLRYTNSVCLIFAFSAPFKSSNIACSGKKGMF